MPEANPRTPSGADHVLYISYDGMLEPLGQSQVIEYLERLSVEWPIHLVSFEKRSDWDDAGRRDAIATRLRNAGIDWHPLRYHKTPTLPATLFDLVQGTIVALWLAARHRVRIIHARSLIPGLIGWIVKLLTGARLLFDIRGFWADERVDGGLWPAGGRLYRGAKRIERLLLRGADHIVTLTHASRTVLIDRFRAEGVDLPPITVIPTCADLDRFRLSGDTLPQPFVLGYLGSIGTWYLFDEVLACFAILRETNPEAKLLVVNRNEADLVLGMVRAANIPECAVEIFAAEHADVPAAIYRMTAGTAIIKPSFSKIASAPTKLAEYLGCGVPCLGNVGVGDMERLLVDERAGVALREQTDAARRQAVAELLDMVRDPQTPARCRAVAERHFSAENGSRAYSRIYAGLL